MKPDTSVTRLPPVELFSIIMPAYNEEAVLENTLQALTGYLDQREFRYEIIVVDDGSRDRTLEIAHELAARHPAIKPISNSGPGGYGFAIRAGLQHYQGGAMVIVTSDGSDSPSDVAAYFDLIQQGYECAFGDRFMPGTTVTGYPRFKLLVNRLANFFLGLVLRSSYRDYTNGFKCYRRHVIDAMQPLVTGQFNITIELAASAMLDKRHFAVTANDWTQRDAGDSSFRIGKLLLPYSMTLVYCLSRHYLRNIRRGD